MTIQEWTETPAREPVVTDVRHTTTRHGLAVAATRASYGWVTLTVVGYLGARRVTGVEGYASKEPDDEDTRARALALADDLYAAGFRGEATDVAPGERTAATA